MKATCLLFLVSFILRQAGFSQQEYWTGQLFTNDRKPVANATVISRLKDSLSIIGYAISGPDGIFRLPMTRTGPAGLLVEIRHVSFETVRKLVFPVSGRDVNPGMVFVLEPRRVDMKEVVIHGGPPLIIRSDTLQFNAASFRTPETRKTEDLLKNIPGFSIDGSGRISFNGKAVEKVLIDGEDLAGQGYRLVTRNLSAEMIDKVQVLQNYQENRLRKRVEQSDAIGINLAIAEGFRGRISGSAGAGLGNSARRILDVNSMYTGRKLKMLGFFQGNNVTEDASGNVGYYYDQEGHGGVSQTESRVAQQVLQPGSIAAPTIKDKYYTVNNDAGMALMTAWKMGRFTKVRAMAGGDMLQRKNRAESKNETAISDAEKWATGNRLRSEAGKKDFLSRISIHRDNGKRHNSAFDIEFFSQVREHHFGNISYGDVSDSLREELNCREQEGRISWEENVEVDSLKVFHSLVSWQGRNIQQALDNQTGRLTGYWGVDSLFNRNHQGLNGRYQRFVVDEGMSGLFQRWKYRYGLLLLRSVNDLSGETTVSNAADSNAFPGGLFQVQKSAKAELLLYTKLDMGFGKGNQAALDYKTGYGKLAVDGEFHNYFVQDLGIGFLHAFGPLNHFRVRYRLQNGFFDFPVIYPSSLVSGDASILNGLTYSGPSCMQSIYCGYQATSIYRQSQWGAHLAISMVERPYSLNSIMQPAYSITGYTQSDRNRSARISVNAEKFIDPFQSRLGFTVTANAIQQVLSLNGIRGKAWQSALTIEGFWTTGFRYPLNLESRGKWFLSKGKWNDMSPNSQVVFEGNIKLKHKLGKKTFAALAWSGAKMQGAGPANGLDLFITGKAGKKWTLSLSGHNLLNTGSLFQGRATPVLYSGTVYSLVGRYLLFRADISL